jgi:hypothetical protein
MIHIGHQRRYDRLPEAEWLLALLFAMAGRDRAAWFRLDYYPDTSTGRMWSYVPPDVIELVPPPAHVWRPLYHAAWRHTRLPKADRLSWWRRARQNAPFPDRPLVGVLPVQCGGSVYPIDILFFRGRTGQHIWVEPRGSLALPAVADAFLRLPLRA